MNAFERTWLGYGDPDRTIALGRIDLEFYGTTIRVRHDCAAGDGRPVRSAPELHEVHTVTNADDAAAITITPSIACNFCALHGWVTNGQWREAS